MMSKAYSVPNKGFRHSKEDQLLCNQYFLKVLLIDLLWIALGKEWSFLFFSNIFKVFCFFIAISDGAIAFCLTF